MERKASGDPRGRAWLSGALLLMEIWTLVLTLVLALVLTLVLACVPLEILGILNGFRQEFLWVPRDFVRNS